MNKIVTLDLNHWIEIAKQKKSGDTFLFDKLVKFVNGNKVIFPLSAMTFIEISAVSQIRQRFELSNIIHSISKGWIIKPFFEVMYFEIFERVANHFEKPIPSKYTDKNALIKGYNYLLPGFKIPPNFKDIGIKPFDKTFLNILFSQYNPKIKDDSIEHLIIKEFGKNDRIGNSGKTIREMEKECVLGLNTKFIELYLKCLNVLNISVSEIENSSTKHFFTAEYSATIPTINVYAKLMMHIFYNPAIKSKANHYYDIAHISASLPHSDVILVDKEMEHFLNKSKLHQKYNTKVMNNINDLIDLLN